MPQDSSSLANLLKQKTILLFEREKELFQFRQSHDRIGAWLTGFHNLESSLYEDAPMGILVRWAELMVGDLEFQAAAVYRLDPAKGRAERVAGEPESRIPGETPMTDEVLGWLRERRAGSFDKGEPLVLRLLSEPTGFEKFHWSLFESRRGDEYLILAGFSALSAQSHPLAKSDLSHFTMFSNHVAALVDKVELISEVGRERSELREANRQLDRSLHDLRNTQEELIQSTRLASLGDMAGRTAHEVLNPITSIQGRATHMLNMLTRVFNENVALLIEIVSAWQDSYDKGGIDGFVRALSRMVETDGGGEITLLSDDLRTLRDLGSYFAKVSDKHAEGFLFLLREVDRVEHIIDGMRSLARKSGTQTKVVLLDVLQETMDTLEDSLEKRHIHFDIHCDPGLEAFVDRYELIQVLTNLTRNSMLAIEEKSGREGGEIEITATKGARRIEIRIRDSGSGVRSEHIPRLFEADFTTRQSESGTGLGLSIAQRLTRGFDGDLMLEGTALGVGSTFLLEVPAYGEMRESGQ